MPERFGNHVGDFGPAQMACADATVKVTLDLAAQFAVSFFRLLQRGLRGQPAESLGVFALKTQQHLLGQRVRQSEGDEIGGAFTFGVWQKAARVDAATQRTWRLGRNAGCPQGKLHTLQPGIAPFEVHMFLNSRLGVG